MDDTELTLEQLPYILSAGVMHARASKTERQRLRLHLHVWHPSQTTIDSYTLGRVTTSKRKNSRRLR